MIEPTFDGQTITIIGGGPSLAEIDLGVLKGHRFIVVNSASIVVRGAATPDDMLYFTDNSWNERWPDRVEEWPGIVVTSNRRSAARLGDRAHHLDVTDLTERMLALPDHVQASSGHIAACYAAIRGAKRVVLVAFEGQPVAGKTHGHDDYTQGDYEAFVDRFLPAWVGLAPAFERMGVDVVNVTPNSAITSFRRSSLASALN